MTTRESDREQSEAREKEITFKCKFCGKTKPLGEMRVLDHFFPSVIACQECEKKMR